MPMQAMLSRYRIAGPAFERCVGVSCQTVPVVEPVPERSVVRKPEFADVGVEPGHVLADPHGAHVPGLGALGPEGHQLVALRLALQDIRDEVVRPAADAALLGVAADIPDEAGPAQKAVHVLVLAGARIARRHVAGECTAGNDPVEADDGGSRRSIHVAIRGFRHGRLAVEVAPEVPVLGMEGDPHGRHAQQAPFQSSPSRSRRRSSIVFSPAAHPVMPWLNFFVHMPPRSRACLASGACSKLPVHRPTSILSTSFKSVPTFGQPPRVIESRAARFCLCRIMRHSKDKGNLRPLSARPER